ncbi:MAG: cytochrome c biogenesis protein CcmE [Rhizobiales bacterium PAR1]|nr:MAG: cytochrome c biogenesis protein CcmE [Rhizobiales bacterium PAR1]
MTRKQKRLALIGGIGVVLALAVGLILTALRDQIVFFRSPTEVVQGKVKPGDSFRLGGLVEKGSVNKESGQIVRFVVTDGANAVKVTFTGLLPDLFREGQGVVAEGKLDPAGQFTASNVLAKHDENYMPREVADSLKKQGVWRDDAGSKGAKP